MGVEDIIEIVILLLFFVLSPLLQRYRRKRQQQQQQQQQQQPQQPGEGPMPGLPSPRWPGPSTPAALPDYSAYLVQSLQELRAHAQRAVKTASSSPLLELPKIAPVAEQLLARTRAEANAVLAITDEATGEAGPAAGRALQLSRAIEEAKLPLARARSARQLLAELTEQRTDPRALQVLGLLDRLTEALTGGSSAGRPRTRLAFLYDGDPRLVGELVGPGEAGLVPIPRYHLDRAAGWSGLARGVGFNLLGAHPEIVGELREVAMTGPLHGRHSNPPFFAGATIEMANAVGAWMHHLAADAVGAHLLGRAYALGVVLSTLGRGTSPIRTATIATEGGRYLAEPPLLLRLTFIDTILDLEGWTEAENGVGALRNRIGLPDEGRYVLPNGLTRRLLLQPMLDYMRDLAQAVETSRLASAEDRRLSELAASRLGTVDMTRIRAAERDFLEGKVPAQPALALLSGAVLAEYEDDSGRRFVEPLVRALVTPPRRARRGRPVARGTVPDRLLLRDALVLSEIL